MDNLKIKEKRTETSRSMGFWSATSIGVGAMIGAGIFAIIGVAVDIAGRYAYLAFMLAGITALLTSYSVSRLAVQFPSKGGRVEYLNKGYGEGVFAGSLNIIMWIGYMIVTSLYARAFGEYSVALLGLSEQSAWLYVFSSSTVVVFVAINFIGAGAVGKSELIIVSIKVAVLLLFGILGLSTLKTGQLTGIEEFDPGSVILAAGVVFMSYEGFGLVANTAEDVNNPGKILPRALFASIIIVIIIYVLVSVAVIGNLSISKIMEAKEYVLAEAARPLLGAVGFTIMGIAALFSTSSAINATIYGPVNMIQETSKAGQAPSFLTRRLLNHQSGVALLVTSIIILVVSNSLDLEAIAETGSLIFLLVYTAVNVANFRLRKKTASNPVIILAGIITTVFSFLALFYFEIVRESISASIFLAIVIAGFIYEWFYQKFTESPDVKKTEKV